MSNINPKKSWHVQSEKNIQKVKNDEKAHEEEEKKKQKRKLIAEQERRLTALRKSAEDRRKQSGDDDSINADDGTKEEGEPKLKHINFFEAEELGLAQVEGNPDYEAEKKAEKAKWEATITTYLGQGSVELTGEKPFYLTLPSTDVNDIDYTLSESKTGGKHFSRDAFRAAQEKLQKIGKTHSILDPLVQMKHQIEREGGIDSSRPLCNLPAPIAPPPLSSSSSFAAIAPVSTTKTKKYDQSPSYQSNKHERRHKHKKHKHKQSSSDASSDDDRNTNDTPKSNKNTSRSTKRKRDSLSPESVDKKLNKQHSTKRNDHSNPDNSDSTSNTSCGKQPAKRRRSGGGKDKGDESSRKEAERAYLREERMKREQAERNRATALFYGDTKSAPAFQAELRDGYSGLSSYARFTGAIVREKKRTTNQP